MAMPLDALARSCDIPARASLRAAGGLRRLLC
jgi:hypothetical protein